MIHQFVHRLAHRNEALKYIRIETTNLCNLWCKMCPQSTAPSTIVRGYMRKDLFESIVDQIARYPSNRDAIFKLHIGGEPLLHKDIMHFIRYSADKGLKPVLTTNATKLSREVAKESIASGLHKIEFSFEGMTPEIYEAYRVGAKYDDVRRNIMDFLDINDAQGKPVVTELVVVDLPNVAQKIKEDFCKSMLPYFDVVNLSGYFDWLGNVSSIQYEHSQYIGCSVLDTDLNVLWDGRVVPCCMDVYGEMVIGDFNKMSYLEVLTAKERQDLRLRLRTGRLDGLPCQYCVVLGGSER